MFILYPRTTPQLSPLDNTRYDVSMIPITESLELGKSTMCQRFQNLKILMGNQNCFMEQGRRKLCSPSYMADALDSVNQVVFGGRNH